MAQGETPLNEGELACIADLYVAADREGNFAFPDSVLGRACRDLKMVPVFDAECEFVCLAPPEKVDFLVRLINTYRTINSDHDVSQGAG